MDAGTNLLFVYTHEQLIIHTLRISIFLLEYVLVLFIHGSIMFCSNHLYIL